MKKSKKLIIAIFSCTLIATLGFSIKCLTEQTSFILSGSITEASYQDYYQPYYDETVYQALTTVDEQFQARGKTVKFSMPDGCYDVVIFQLTAHYGSDVSISTIPIEDVRPVYHCLYAGKTIELQLDESAWYSLTFVAKPKDKSDLFEGELSVLVDGVDVRIDNQFIYLIAR